MMSETLWGSSVARFCPRLCVGLRFPVSAEAGNPRPCRQTYIRPGRVSSSLPERGVIPGDCRLAAPARSPVVEHVVHHRCDADPVPGKKHEKVKLERFLGVTGEADTESTFWADSLILEDLLQEEKPMPAHWGCGICLDHSWDKLKFSAIMPSFCGNVRRGILRRYRQVPRTEADGAFSYNRSSNRRGLVSSGRSNSTPRLFLFYLTNISNSSV